MKRIIIGLLVLTLTTSCNKFLDVRPEGEFTSDQLLKNAKGFEDALYGAYASLAGTNMYGSNLSHNTLDVLAQYFVCYGNTTFQNLTEYNYKNASVESRLLSVWADMYKNISNVNNVLINLEKNGRTNLEYYDVYKGEALGLRAFMHFDLLRLYSENILLNPNAKGIPYSTDFKLVAPQMLSAAEVYTKIIADLLEAEKLLGADKQLMVSPKKINENLFLNDREIHFNLYAVQATLARVYLAMGKNKEAAEYAVKVIESGKFKQMEKTDVGAGLMRGMIYPNEAIFGLYTTTYFERVKELFYIQTSFFSFSPRDNLAAQYISNSAENDYRKTGFFIPKPSEPNKFLFVKLVDRYQLENIEYSRRKDLIKGINMLRLSEMYYIAAEALLPTNADKARDYFDVVLASRGLAPLKGQTPQKDLTLDMITAERYKEFVGEGQTFFNMKRLNAPIVDINGKTIPASNSVYVWPIPLEETEYRK